MRPHGWAAVGPWSGAFGAAPPPEVFDQLLDVLGAVLGRHQHRIRSRHRHHVGQSDHGEQPPVGSQVAAVDILGHHVADDDVAVGVLYRHVHQRSP